MCVLVRDGLWRTNKTLKKGVLVTHSEAPCGTLRSRRGFTGVWLRCLRWLFEYHAGLRGHTLLNVVWNASVWTTSRGWNIVTQQRLSHSVLRFFTPHNYVTRQCETLNACLKQSPISTLALNTVFHVNVSNVSKRGGGLKRLLQV